MLKNKKIIIIILVILLLIVLGLILYFFVYQKEKTPIISEKSVSKLTNKKIKYVKVLQDGRTIRFNDIETELFKELNLENGAEKTLSNIPLAEDLEVTWSPNGEKVIIKISNNRALLGQLGYFLDNEAPDNFITTWVLDFNTSKLQQLSKSIGGIDWLSDDKIIYYFSDALDYPESTESFDSSLVEADWNGKNYQKISDLNTEDFYNAKIVVSPNKHKVIIYPEVEGFGDNNFYIYDLDEKSLQKITEDGLTPSAAWSSKGEHILFYKVDNNGENPILWLANQNGVEKKNTKLLSPYGLAITSPDDKYVYAVVPKNNKIELNNFGERTGDDLIYEINSGSLDKTIIFDTSNHEEIDTITEIGLLGEDIFIVSNNNIYRIKI